MQFNIKMNIVKMDDTIVIINYQLINRQDKYVLLLQVNYINNFFYPIYFS